MTSRAVIGSRIRVILGSTWFRHVARALVGAGVLVGVAAHVGSGPFLRGILGIDVGTIAIAVVLSFTATLAAAWRWSVIARRLGVGLPLGEAVGRYYRSQFLNMMLPGGVVGDVDRAVAQGRDAGDVPQAARAVVIERSVGQVVQLALAVVVLVGFGIEFAGALLPVIVVGLAAVMIVVVVAVVSSCRVRRTVRREFTELRAGVGSPGAILRVVGASIVVVGCHVATFGLAIAAVGAHVPPPRVAALALVILLAGSIPLNLGGWGPREGVAGWAFAVAGLGAAAGSRHPPSSGCSP